VNELCDQVALRCDRARQVMKEKGFAALLIYGNNKINGALRYMTGYFPDRGGWIALGADRDRIHIFDAATLVLPAVGEPVLALDPGQLLDRPSCIQRTTTSGFGESSAAAPTLDQALAAIIRDTGGASRGAMIGVETWEKFPAPLYLKLKDLLPGVQLSRSTIVEDLMLIKSEWELVRFRRAGEIGDIGHAAFETALRERDGKSELELIRVAESEMRIADPVYEECSPISPSLICSGPSDDQLIMLHVPLGNKTVQLGDVINWDICGRYCGYPIDTSRTRVLGKPTREQRRAYEASTQVARTVREKAMPGVNVQALVDIAQKTAGEMGFQLWDRFLGHGLGLDVHSRPDIGFESIDLKENMVFTIEPRIALGGYLYGNEDMIHLTTNGAESLTNYPWDPFEV